MRLLIEHPSDDVARQIARLVEQAGGRAFYVGGCVRDALLALPVEDLDIEVYGVEAAALVGLLEARFAVSLVGAEFAVIKLRDHDIDVSLPRREQKDGVGHRGFAVQSDPAMHPAEAGSRRDLTINAILADVLTGEVHDHHGGLDDLERRVARHVGPDFADDPLRVLRVMQFAARFELAVHPLTVDLCAAIDREDLPAERVFGEFEKMLLTGRRPSRGLEFLATCGWVEHLPELAALIGCEQDPLWHPEGDAYAHTALCLDEFARERTGDRDEDLVVGLAVLCHDLGKPATTAVNDDGRITSHGHERAGVEPTHRLLERLGAPRSLHREVSVLVENHLRPTLLHEARASDAAIRRLARSVGDLERLVRVAKADRNGRAPLPREEPYESGRWLLARATELAVTHGPPPRLVEGRHVIARFGLSPGPAVGRIVNACYEAQLDGAFTTTDDGLAWAADNLADEIARAVADAG